VRAQRREREACVTAAAPGLLATVYRGVAGAPRPSRLLPIYAALRDVNPGATVTITNQRSICGGAGRIGPRSGLDAGGAPHIHASLSRAQPVVGLQLGHRVEDVQKVLTAWWEDMARKTSFGRHGGGRSTSATTTSGTRCTRHGVAEIDTLTSATACGVGRTRG
jgi:hypothetical protein